MRRAAPFAELERSSACSANGSRREGCAGRAAQRRTRPSTSTTTVLRPTVRGTLAASRASTTDRPSQDKPPSAERCLSGAGGFEYRFHDRVRCSSSLTSASSPATSGSSAARLAARASARRCLFSHAFMAISPRLAASRFSRYLWRPSSIARTNATVRSCGSRASTSSARCWRDSLRVVWRGGGGGALKPGRNLDGLTPYCLRDSNLSARRLGSSRRQAGRRPAVQVRGATPTWPPWARILPMTPVTGERSQSEENCCARICPPSSTSVLSSFSGAGSQCLI
jgi:hypothetical protein